MTLLMKNCRAGHNVTDREEYKNVTVPKGLRFSSLSPFPRMANVEHRLQSKRKNLEHKTEDMLQKECGRSQKDSKINRCSSVEMVQTKWGPKEEKLIRWEEKQRIVLDDLEFSCLAWIRKITYLIMIKKKKRKKSWSCYQNSIVND